ncbi:MAG: DUF4442 domain-containing protein, partial [Alphaproteobacteria bacterium]|nr:DUF4442 domain-containing protein [Alphaproteobacteria bacterium]
MFDVAGVDAMLRRLCPLYGHIDLHVDAMHDGVYRCRVPLNAQNGNHLNTVHAAVKWAAAEMLGGLVAMRIIRSEDPTAVHVAVQSMSIDFQRPARSAIIAEAMFHESDAERIERGIRRGENETFRLNAVIRTARGETVAITEAAYVIRPLR